MKRLLVSTVLLLTSFADVAVAVEEFPDRYVEAIEVRVVNVDVVVTDRRGNPVTDLKREDFELLVGGKPVEISYFSRISEGRLEATESPEDSSPSATVEAAWTPVTWAVFFDRRDLRPAIRNHALLQLTRFLEKSMESGDRGILATFDGRMLRVRGSVTSDRGLLLETFSSVEKERASPDVTAIQTLTLRSDIQQARFEFGRPDVTAMMLALKVTAQIEAEAQRSRNGMVALGSFLDVLAGIDGRLALVYVGPGFHTIPALALSHQWHDQFPQYSREQWAPRPEEHQPALEKELDRLLTRTSATRTALYTIHTGFATGDDLSSEVGAADRAEMHSTGLAREMAERTGGRFLKGNIHVAQQLETIRRDLSHYYSLGYVASGPTGITQKLSVRVKRDGLHVRHRQAVHERSEEDKAGDSAVAALFGPGDENPLSISVETGSQRRVGRGRERLLPVRVRVPLDSLTFLPDGEVYRAAVTFHFALGGGDGTVWRLDSREQALAIPKEELAAALQQGITYSVEIPLPGEGMRLSVVVQDRTALIFSSVIITLPRS